MLAAREATQTIPVVGFLYTNMIAAGLIRTFARSGSNVTGVAHHCAKAGQTEKVSVRLGRAGTAVICVLPHPHSRGRGLVLVGAALNRQGRQVESNRF